MFEPRYVVTPKHTLRGGHLTHVYDRKLNSGSTLYDGFDERGAIAELERIRKVMK